MIINFSNIGPGQGGGSGSGSTVRVNQILSAGTQIASITVDNNTTMLYAPEGGGEGSEFLPLVSVEEAKETALSAGTAGYFYVSGQTWLDAGMCAEIYGEEGTFFPVKIKVPGVEFETVLVGREFYPSVPQERREIEDETFIQISYNAEPEEGENHFSIYIEEEQLDPAEITEDGDSAVFHMYYYDNHNQRYINASGYCHYAYEYEEYWGEETDVIYLDNTEISGFFVDTLGEVRANQAGENIYLVNIPEGVYKFDEGGFMVPYQTLLKKENMATINGSAITNGGNITIQGGGGSVIELTQAEYDALVDKDPDTTYIISDAQSINMDNYASQADLTTLSGSVGTALEGKADKANVTANTNSTLFPTWNEQGVITGVKGSANDRFIKVNGSRFRFFSSEGFDTPMIYAPTSTGTQGQPLIAGSNGYPTWGTYKFQFITQTAYDALTTPDSTTIYFIIGD